MKRIHYLAAALLFGAGCGPEPGEHIQLQRLGCEAQPFEIAEAEAQLGASVEALLAPHEDAEQPAIDGDGQSTEVAWSVQFGEVRAVGFASGGECLPGLVARAAVQLSMADGPARALEGSLRLTHGTRLHATAAQIIPGADCPCTLVLQDEATTGSVAVECVVQPDGCDVVDDLHEPQTTVLAAW